MRGQHDVVSMLPNKTVTFMLDSIQLVAATMVAAGRGGGCGGGGACWQRRRRPVLAMVVQAALVVEHGAARVTGS